ncbi:MAG: choice-of-anchor Q domain-containing protein, partial [Chloroflexota bacterium]
NLNISSITIQHGKGTTPIDQFGIGIVPGGGIFATGSVTLTNSTVSDNTVTSPNDGGVGGGIAAGSVALTGSTVSDNTANSVDGGPATGGGIYASNAVTLTGSTVSGNSAAGESKSPAGGGGIEATTVTLTNSTVSGNTATASENTDGGGIEAATVTLSGSTVSDNHAVAAFIFGPVSSEGGGIFTYDSGSVTLTDSTVSGNTAEGAGNVGGGAGIYANGSLTLISSTVSGNTATSTNGGSGAGGGIIAGTGTLRDTILAGNTADAGPDCSGTLTTQGYNLLGNSSGCAGLTDGMNGDHVGTSTAPIDPRFSPLAANGGPTQTQALLPGSPAIDAGNPVGCTDVSGALLTTDQRGFPRPSPAGGRCDIGAYEVQFSLALTPPGAPNSTATAAVLPGGTSGVSYTQALTASGGSGSGYGHFTVVGGSLPPGIALDPNNGMIGGTPNGSGTFTFTVAVSDSVGNEGEQLYSLTVAASGGSSCPSGWSCADIGTPFPRGSESQANGTWTVQGSGDIWGSADNFHFDWQTLGGDGAVSTQVLSQSDSDPWAKAGVMLRGGIDRGAPFYAALVTPGQGIIVQYRSASGGTALSVSSQPGSAPVYLSVARVGTSFSAYSSSDGIHWSLLPRSTVTISSLSGPLLAGLATTSHKNGTLSTATFDAVGVDASATCPSPWNCADIGKPFPAGSASSAAGIWTAHGSGDIWGSADNFHFDWQSLSGDGSVTAQVLGQTATDPWAKAGVMLRGGTDRGAPFYAALVTPGHGIIVQYRSGSGAAAISVSSQPGSAPVYLRVTRSGNSFSAYNSSDGATWTLLPKSTVSISSLSGPLLAGLATTSHKNGLLSTATFDAITPAAP